MIKLNDIKPNPDNPRVLKDDKFKKLKASIQEFPKMMSLRPIVVDETNTALGGNMRLRALQDLGYKEVADDWIKKASELTEDEKKRFIISDNVGFGEWDWDVLANEWDAEELAEWGLDFPIFSTEPEFDELSAEEKNNKPTIKITFDSVQELEKAKKEIEILLKDYINITISVSAGEL